MLLQGIRSTRQCGLFSNKVRYKSRRSRSANLIVSACHITNPSHRPFNHITTHLLKPTPGFSNQANSAVALMAVQVQGRSQESLKVTLNTTPRILFKFNLPPQLPVSALVTCLCLFLSEHSSLYCQRQLLGLPCLALTDRIRGHRKPAPFFSLLSISSSNLESFSGLASLNARVSLTSATAGRLGECCK